MELEDSDIADAILIQSAKVRNPEGKAVIYPPQELFQSIKSIEANCKLQKDKDPNFRYQVRLGKEKLELHIKQLDDIEYTQVQLDLFGPYIKPNLTKFNVQTCLNISPPKGRTMKRARESPGTTRNPPKR